MEHGICATKVMSKQQWRHSVAMTSLLLLLWWPDCFIHHGGRHNCCRVPAVNYVNYDIYTENIIKPLLTYRILWFVLMTGLQFLINFVTFLQAAPLLFQPLMAALTVIMYYSSSLKTRVYIRALYSCLLHSFVLCRLYTLLHYVSRRYSWLLLSNKQVLGFLMWRHY